MRRTIQSGPLFQTKESETVQEYKNSYPLCHLLLEKGLNYSKDPFEYPRLINYVNGLDSDRKPIL